MNPETYFSKKKLTNFNFIKNMIIALNLKKTHEYASLYNISKDELLLFKKYL
jgi:hypothetical protein